LLTDQGRQLYERTRIAFSLAEEAVSEVQHESVALAGLCRISLPPDLATAVLGLALIEFQTRHPAVKLDISLVSCGSTRVIGGGRLRSGRAGRDH
jgi:DNA-binding transcriptional LysR family regulator